MNYTLPFRIASIHGVGRSGTSWLGQIVNSHPDTAYRHQPLFSYTHKSAIDENSTLQEMFDFFNQVYNTKDQFVLQIGDGCLGKMPHFEIKSSLPTLMVMKETRYHYLIPKFLETFPDYKMIGIVRHPCAVINSFLNMPREFRPDWSIEKEWRFAPSKNQGHKEDFFGFEKWKELAYIFFKMRSLYPEQFLLIKYSDLVKNPIKVAEKIMSKLGLKLHSQTVSFIKESQANDSVDYDYSVHKSPAVVDRWKNDLLPQIRDEIYEDIQGTKLEEFLS